MPNPEKKDPIADEEIIEGETDVETEATKAPDELEKEKTPEEIIEEFDRETQTLQDRVENIESQITDKQELIETNKQLNLPEKTYENLPWEIEELQAEKEELSREIEKRGPSEDELVLQQKLEEIEAQIAQEEKQNQDSQEFEELKKKREELIKDLEEKKLERIKNYYQEQEDEMPEEMSPETLEKALNKKARETGLSKEELENRAQEFKAELREKVKKALERLFEKLKSVYEKKKKISKTAIKKAINEDSFLGELPEGMKRGLAGACLKAEAKRAIATDNKEEFIAITLRPMEIWIHFNALGLAGNEYLKKRFGEKIITKEKKQNLKNKEG